MFELMPFGEPNTCSRLPKLDRNILVAAGIEGTNGIEHSLSFVAYEPKDISLQPKLTMRGFVDILSRARVCSAR